MIGDQLVDQLPDYLSGKAVLQILQEFLSEKMILEAIKKMTHSGILTD
jgi:hypothetical protein